MAYLQIRSYQRELEKTAKEKTAKPEHPPIFTAILSTRTPPKNPNTTASSTSESVEQLNFLNNYR